MISNCDGIAILVTTDSSTGGTETSTDVGTGGGTDGRTSDGTIVDGGTGGDSEVAPAWKTVETAGFSTYEVQRVAFVADPSNNYLYIAYQDDPPGGLPSPEGKFVIKQISLTGCTEWSDVAETPYNGSASLVTDLYGTLYVAYLNTDPTPDQFGIQKYNTSNQTWDYFDSFGSTSGSCSFLVYSGVPYVACNDGSENGFISKHAGTWQPMRPTGGESFGKASGGTYTGVLSLGMWYEEPCVAFKDGNDNINVKKLHIGAGTWWENLGTVGKIEFGRYGVVSLAVSS